MPLPSPSGAASTLTWSIPIASKIFEGIAVVNSWGVLQRHQRQVADTPVGWQTCLRLGRNEHSVGSEHTVISSRRCRLHDCETRACHCNVSKLNDYSKRRSRRQYAHWPCRPREEGCVSDAWRRAEWT